MCDYLMLNEKKKIGMVSESKPDAATVEMRSLVKPGGGYTFCNFPGVWKNITCYDYLSHYPTTMINFNISPEKFIKDVEPDLKSVFNDEELSYLISALSF
jgi:DNA polymerase elongation subunit (family B)